MFDENKFDDGNSWDTSDSLMTLPQIEQHLGYDVNDPLALTFDPVQDVHMTESENAENAVRIICVECGKRATWIEPEMRFGNLPISLTYSHTNGEASHNESQSRDREYMALSMPNRESVPHPGQPQYNPAQDNLTQMQGIKPSNITDNKNGLNCRAAEATVNVT